MKPARGTLVASASSLLATVLIVTSMTCGALPASAAGSTLSEAGSRAFAELSGCLAGGDALLAAIVVDESASLQSTDPRALRLDGVRAAVDALADVQASTGRDVRVEVALSTFARGYDSLADWGRLTPARAAYLQDVASSELPRRNTGNATDYREALTGARKQIEARSARLGDERVCKAVLWFTDGALDVDEQTGQAARDLCAPNGIVDSVRDAGINVIALALLAPGADAVTPRQRDQLRAVAEGSGRAQSCGTTPIRSDASSGALLAASDVGSLGRLFAGAIARAVGDSQGTSFSCPGAGCPGGVTTFTVDRGVGGFRLVIASDRDTSFVVEGPNGQQVVLSSTGRQSDAGVTSTVRRRAGLTTATVTFETLRGPHVGQWRLSPRGRARAPYAGDLFWSWGATPHLAGDPTVVKGSPSELAIVLRGSSGEPVDPDLYRTLEISATLEGDPVDLDYRPDTRDYVVRANLSANDPRTSATLNLTAQAVTSPSSVRLGPVTQAQALTLNLPPGYPVLSPSRLDLGGTTGTEGAVARVRVTGSDQGATKACLVGNSFEAPTGAGSVAADPAQTCVDVPANASRLVTVDLAPESAADGQVRGHLSFRLTAANGAGQTTVDLPTEFRIARPVDEPFRWLLTLALVALALLIPFVLLHLANAFLLGRFAKPRTLRAGQVAVVVGAGGITRVDASKPVLIHPDDLTNVTDVGATTFSRHGVTLKRRLPWWPLTMPSATATSHSGHVLVSSRSPYADAKDSSSAPASLSLGRDWFLVRTGPAGDEPGLPVEAHLVVLISNEQDGLKTRVEEIRRFDRWDTLHEALQRGSRQSAEVIDVSGPLTSGGSTVPTEGGKAAPPPPDFDEETSTPSVEVAGPRHSSPPVKTRPTTTHDDAGAPPPPNF